MGFDDINKDDEYMEEGPLPGFRFHPTDEELVGFYLRRKLEKKPICLELIKHIDIYQYDPWDLPKTSSTGGDKEWYFFCKRGRKYKNSIRPNRVTSSGFWKATGIDKPVYGGDGKDCIGLKKTLVYYRGSAGKGTKTDWMMHEFRLPSNNVTNNNNAPSALEAEIWTLCRILKRNASQRKQFTTDEKQSLAAKRTDQKTTRISTNANQEAYISFEKPHAVIDNNNTNIDQRHSQFHIGQLSSSVELEHQPSQLFLNLWTSPAVKDLFTFDNWDEHASVVKYGVDSIGDINNHINF